VRFRQPRKLASLALAGVMGAGALAALPALRAGPAALGSDQVRAGPEPTPAAAPQIQVSGGVVRGRWLDGGAGAVFRGIPFAAPPEGPLRWREPQPVVPWSGVRDALQPGPPPAQESFGFNERMAAEGREDCLYLDVWTPTLAAGAKRPVMVWIHGGANLGLAGGGEPVYEGRSLIARGVVLVVLEYRSGVFGFLAHPELTRESPHHASGNYALLDQIAGLQWVRNHIARFGGDPAMVTVFGQSAGGWNIAALMSSPLAHGLFCRAILESGVPPRNLCRSLPELEKRGEEIAAHLKAPPQGALAFLRGVAAAQLLQAGAGLNLYSLDGWVLPTAPFAVWKSHREEPVPVIIGNNAVEFPSKLSEAEIASAIRETFGDLAPRALVLYGLDRAGTPAVHPVYGSVQDQWGSDLYFRMAGIIHGEWHRRAGNHVWEYEFDRAVAPRTQVRHSDELAYVFGNFRSEGGMVSGKFDATDRKLSDQMQAYWTNFARTGDPNGPGLPAWREYDGRERSYLVFTAAGGVSLEHDERGPVADLFRELLARPSGPADDSRSTFR